MTNDSYKIMIKDYHFNSHAHVERDVFDGKEWNTEKNFNSHAHVERDNGQFNSTTYKNNFNSHAHVERDLPL